MCYAMLAHIVYLKCLFCATIFTAIYATIYASLYAGVSACARLQRSQHGFCASHCGAPVPARNPLFPSGKENPFGHCGFIQAPGRKVPQWEAWRGPRAALGSHRHSWQPRRTVQILDCRTGGGNLNKYIWLFGQINCVIWKNIFFYLDKYIFVIWTKTFCGWDKYISQFGQIYLEKDILHNNLASLSRFWTWNRSRQKASNIQSTLSRTRGGKKAAPRIQTAWELN